MRSRQYVETLLTYLYQIKSLDKYSSFFLSSKYNMFNLITEKNLPGLYTNWYSNLIYI